MYKCKDIMSINVACKHTIHYNVYKLCTEPHILFVMSTIHWIDTRVGKRVHSLQVPKTLIEIRVWLLEEKTRQGPMGLLISTCKEFMIKSIGGKIDGQS